MMEIKKVKNKNKKIINYKKVHIKTQSKRKDVHVTFISQETKNSNLFDKSSTQEPCAVKCHIQH